MRPVLLLLVLAAAALLFGCSSDDTCNDCDSTSDAGPPAPGPSCAVNNGGCDPLTMCSASASGIDCGPCPTGYSGDGLTGCTDVDECASGSHGCDPLAGCVNDPGTFHCGACASGFEDVLGDGTQCRCSGADCWTAVDADRSHACGIRSGELYCWGNNEFGQLGLGLVGGFEMAPNRIGARSDWEQVAVGGEHTCAVSGGMLYCWGSSSGGQLGSGASGNEVREPAPVMVDAGLEWSLVAAGTAHTCGLSGGALYCWGDNAAGQIGDGTQTDRATPVQVGAERDWTTVAVRGLLSCGVRSGELYCWGDERLTPQNRPSVYKLTPERIGERADWEAVAVDSFNLCAIASGELYCWGFNGAGMLGDGTTTDRPAPVRIGDDADWNLVTVSGNHACGVRGSDLYCWGGALYGAIGSGETTAMACTTGILACQLSPLAVDTSGAWSAIAAAIDFTCGLRSGQALCWGKNDVGQLGDGTTEQRNAPVAIAAP